MTMKSFTTTLVTALAVLLITAGAHAGSTGSGEYAPDQKTVDSLAAELFRFMTESPAKKVDSAAGKLSILRFNTKVVKRYSGGMMKIGVLVMVLNPNEKPLEICVDFLDADGFAIDQFCRRTRYSPEKFTWRGDTTVFRFTRILEDARSWVNTEASVRLIKAR
jgi:hypothetical protein